MRDLIVGAVVLLSLAIPQLAWAGVSSPGQTAPTGASAGVELGKLFSKLHIDLIAAAHAAECKEEGEICKSSADCCSGLDCSGDPQATCRPQE